MSGMDFFGHQERARASSRRLVVLFVLAVIGITAAIYFAAIGILGIAGQGRSGWQPEVLLVVTAGTLLVIGIATWFKTAQLKSGGGKVAQLLGGKLVPPDTTDPQERMLRNVVEEIAIASGVPVPEIYVLDAERGVNAFAAGWATTDAAVAVTRGTLETLTRDELQGVVAHEFSHVFHGDMRLNIRLMGVLFGIVCIATIGRIVIRTVGRGGGSSDKKGGVAAIVLFGVALMAIGWIGVLFARLIQSALSRQREYLADASAVQYTRNPRGLGSALAKIAGIGGRLETAHAEEASHMLFADGMRRWFGGGFATHPPIEQRIERVLPGYLRQVQKDHDPAAAVAAVAPPPGTAGFAGATAAAPSGRSRDVLASTIVGSVGDPQPHHVDAARALLRDLPLEVIAAAREPSAAQSLAFALLMQRGGPGLEAQIALLEDLEEPIVYETRTLSQTLSQIDARARLPLLELAIPALRQLSPGERRRLRTTARALALADEQLTPFEFALLRIIERHVPLPEDGPRRTPGRTSALVEHQRATAVVLSTLAHCGAGDDRRAAAAAFAAGRDHLQVPATIELLPAEAGSLLQLEVAVAELASVSPFGKRNLIAACAAAAGADGRLAYEEADLLRALAELWECPIPLVTARDGQPLQAAPTV